MSSLSDLKALEARSLKEKYVHIKTHQTHQSISKHVFSCSFREFFSDF